MSNLWNKVRSASEIRKTMYDNCGIDEYILDIFDKIEQTASKGEFTTIHTVNIPHDKTDCTGKIVNFIGEKGFRVMSHYNEETEQFTVKAIADATYAPLNVYDGNYIIDQ